MDITSKKNQYVVAGILADLAKGEISATDNALKGVIEMGLIARVTDETAEKPEGKGNRRPKVIVLTDAGKMLNKLVSDGVEFGAALSTASAYADLVKRGGGALVRGLLNGGLSPQEAIEHVGRYVTAVGLDIPHSLAVLSFSNEAKQVGRLKAEITRKTPLNAVPVSEPDNDDDHDDEAADAAAIDTAIIPAAVVNADQGIHV